MEVFETDILASHKHSTILELCLEFPDVVVGLIVWKSDLEAGIRVPHLILHRLILHLTATFM